MWELLPAATPQAEAGSIKLARSSKKQHSNKKVCVERTPQSPCLAAMVSGPLVRLTLPRRSRQVCIPRQDVTTQLVVEALFLNSLPPSPASPGIGDPAQSGSGPSRCTCSASTWRCIPVHTANSLLTASQLKKPAIAQLQRRLDVSRSVAMRSAHHDLKTKTSWTLEHPERFN